MVIQNFKKLSKNHKKKTALSILEAGLEAAKPENFLKKFVKRNHISIGKTKINLKNYDNVFLVAFGKSAASMANTVDSLTKIKKGIVVFPKISDAKKLSKKFQVFKSGHPLPNKTSVKAAKSILEFLWSRDNNDFVIFLVSGGSSALVSLPYVISLSEKINLTNHLLKSGATIQEMNCIRKHLSMVKGGRLVQNMKCKGVALVMSDVVGDDLSSIASGMTYCDKTRYQDALKIIKKYKLAKKIPKNVIRTLTKGVNGKIPETPKKSKLKHVIIANNSQCLDAMVKESKRHGLASKSVTVSGDVKNVASNLAKRVPKKKNSALIFGGEPTVKVLGKGTGGRNQELVLRLIEKLQNSKQKLVIASIGTDGIDGNTKYAGAISDNQNKKSLQIKSFLRTNDSSLYFQKHDGVINTGYTNTNLLDIGLILN